MYEVAGIISNYRVTHTHTHLCARNRKVYLYSATVISLPEHHVGLQGYRSIRATQSVNAGSWFYEVKILDVSSSDGHIRLVHLTQESISFHLFNG